MLDILANFDWKQPIYFTGGANAAEEYIWLKDYLQLDLMSFKLVPIKTSNEGKTMFDMGRIDPDKMYENLQKLEWRNINSGKIYLDEQTKRNAISLRNNLMRLSEAFADQKNIAKAVEVLDLSLEKMPIADFDHFSISIEYPELYYKLNETAKARATSKTLITLFKDKLRWLSTFSDADVSLIFDEIDTNLYMYRRILEYANRYDTDKKYIDELQSAFLDTVKLFEHLMPSESE